MERCSIWWTSYSPLTGAALQPQQIGHNSTWRWESPVSVAPLSWVHLHQSEKQMGKIKAVKKKRKKKRQEQMSRRVCVLATHWPTAWFEECPHWPAWPGPRGWTPDGAWAMCTSPPWTCTWLAHDLTDKRKKKQWLIFALCLYRNTAGMLFCLYKLTGWFLCSPNTGRFINHLVKHLWFSSLGNAFCTDWYYLYTQHLLTLCHLWISLDIPNI